ncbi:MAG: hypothetical protein PWQ82_1311 [Thermosediminibacterales bacterium]|nr:hypothetical protein [Thermosediminibacterales bacterium]MDK2836363.1 hypothetical protein [Thermosediminibacterales bacterium]
MDFLEQIQNAEKIIEFLKELGAYRVKLIKTRDIVIDERVRFQCQHSGCPNFGKPMCPPNVPDVESFNKTLNRYTFGILVQVKGEIKGEDWVKETDVYALKLHDYVYKAEKKAFSLGFPFAAGLIGGSCKLCAECSKTCSNREKARPSMEAMGIDVLATCRKAGMPVCFKKDQVVWTGLVLLD